MKKEFTPIFVTLGIDREDDFTNYDTLYAGTDPAKALEPDRAAAYSKLEVQTWINGVNTKSMEKSYNGEWRVTFDKKKQLEKEITDLAELLGQKKTMLYTILGEPEDEHETTGNNIAPEGK